MNAFNEELELACMKWAYVVDPNDQTAHRLFSEIGAVDAMNRLENGKELYAPKYIEADQFAKTVDRWRERLPTPEQLEHDLKLMDELDIVFVSYMSENYPQKLKRLGYTQPVGLWWRGAWRPEDHRTADNRILLATGGERDCSQENGWRQHAFDRTTALELRDKYAFMNSGNTDTDYTIMQWFMHKHSENDKPFYIVQANGLDKLYPKRHQCLLEKTLSVGCAISELPPGTRPSRYQVTNTNRIQIALADAIYVSQTGMNSHAKTLAQQAMREFQTPVCAMPMTPYIIGTDPVVVYGRVNRATNQLIKDGAHLVESPQDIEKVMTQHH